MFGHSLHAKLLLPLLLCGLLMGVIGAWATYQIALSELRHQLVHRGQLLGAAIDQSFSIAAQEFEIRLAVEELIRQEFGVSRITVATGSPFTVWASSFHPGSDPDLATQSMLRSLSDAIELGQFGHSFLDSGDLVMILPIGQQKLTTPIPQEELNEPLEAFQLPLGSYRGAAYLQFNWRSIEEDSKAILQRSLAIFIVGVVLIVLVALFLVRRVVLEQLIGINSVIRRYERGEHGARVDSSSEDEIGRMADAFDGMLNSLADSQELSGRIFRASPGLAAISRPEDGMHYDVNSKWTEVLGYSHEEAMANTVIDLGIWANPEERSEFVGLLRADGSVRNFEAIFQTKSGRKLDVLVAGEYLKSTEKDLMLVVSTDITDLKVMEQTHIQAQKMEAVGQLTGGVAHDFNNLLAVIVGNAELLEVTQSTEYREIDAIIRASMRGSELTQRLLAFSRKQALVPKVVNLGELVSGMSELLNRTLGETIEIVISRSPDIWEAFADPGQVENVLLNLSLNSRDAMPGGGKLTIECHNAVLDESYVAQNPEATTGDFVTLQVSDEGTGMPAEVQAQAFDPFFTTKEVGKGSGLGLSMIYGFARQSGGHVKLYSEEGIGTTVRLYLPRAKGVPQCEAVARVQDAPRGNGETILVIEDDPEVRALAVNLLKNLNYRFIEAEDAAAANAVLAGGRQVDLVLSDVILPGGISGPEFANVARETYPNFKVVFMSGYPAEAAKGNGFLGSDQVLLNKPFQRIQLALALHAALS